VPGCDRAVGLDVLRCGAIRGSCWVEVEKYSQVTKALYLG
jgi:hypothetical protein